MGGHESDQAETGDDDGFAELGIQIADALKSDGADHGEGGFLIGNVVRDLGAEIFGDADEFGVVSVGGDAVADLEFGDAASDVDDGPHVAVAEGEGLAQLVEDGLEGRHQSVGAYFIEDLFDFVRLLAGLVDEVGLAELHEHAFGAQGDEGP